MQLYASASPAAPDLVIREVFGGVDGPVVSGPAEQSPYAPGTSTASALLDWNCSQGRVFVAIGGGERSAPVSVPTPSCADRLRVETARRLYRGANLRITVRDTWWRGNVTVRMCVTAPNGASGCVDAHMPPDQLRTSRVGQVLLAGRWTVSVSYGDTELTRVVKVVPPIRGARRLPRILVTGDSMIEGPSDALVRALRGRARVIPDFYVASGITRPFIVDWGPLPAMQVAAYRQDATVVSLGMGDSRPFETADGTAHCCGEAWTDAFARAVRRMMRTYLQGRRSAVVWLNEPYPRDEGIPGRIEAINTAIDRAAAGLRRVRVLDLDKRFTPDGTFRMWERYRGRRVRLRASQGYHLSRAASRIVTKTMILPALVDLGLLDG